MRILAYTSILANRIFASSHGREIPNFLEIVADSLFNEPATQASNALATIDDGDWLNVTRATLVSVNPLNITTIDPSSSYLHTDNLRVPATLLKWRTFWK
jgi:hypothetical protein